METSAEENIAVASPLGLLALRRERDEDDAFRFALFCQSRPAELAQLPIEAAALQQLMRFQYQAQTKGYRVNFPGARFDIIELEGLPVGRIVVDRPGTGLRIVDQAIVPALRSRGLGTAIMQALIDEAGRAGLPVRLNVASTNHRSMRLYLRLGFVPIASDALFVEMERPAPGSNPMHPVPV